MHGLRDAIAKLQSTNDWEGSPNDEWTDVDSVILKEQTGLSLPSDLEWILRRYGWNGFADPRLAAFLAIDGDGGVTQHETQVLMNDREGITSLTRIFALEDGLDSRVPLPMLFFGTADGGHTHTLMNGKDHSDRAVYVWERSDDPWGTGTNARGLTKAGDDLASFLMNLRPWDEL